MSVAASTPASAPYDKAGEVLKQNLDSISHMVALQLREMAVVKAASTRAKSSLTKAVTAAKARGRAPSGATTKHLDSVLGSMKTMKVGVERVALAGLWQVVMLVTCVETYLQDLLSIAASVEPDLMSKSARTRMFKGGPTRWVSSLKEMGVREYPEDLAPRLERIWGIRHVVVHAAGVADANFVKRHPGVVAAPGDRLRVTYRDFERFVQAVGEFVDPTEEYFLARYAAIEKRKSLGSR